MDPRIHRLLISFLCSLMLMSSQSSMDLILADVGSGIAAALSIAAGVAGVKPNPADVPPVKSEKTVSTTKKTKSESDTPLSGVARIGQSFGGPDEIDANNARLMGGLGFRNNETPRGKILDLTNDDGLGRALYVIQRTPNSPVYIMFGNFAEREGVLYLTSPRGDLQRVVLLERGRGGRRVDITDALRKSFNAEKTFWLEKERELNTQAAANSTIK